MKWTSGRLPSEVLLVEPYSHGAGHGPTVYRRMKGAFEEVGLDVMVIDMAAEGLLIRVAGALLRILNKLLGITRRSLAVLRFTKLAFRVQEFRTGIQHLKIEFPFMVAARSAAAQLGSDTLIVLCTAFARPVAIRACLFRRFNVLDFLFDELPGSIWVPWLAPRYKVLPCSVRLKELNPSFNTVLAHLPIVDRILADVDWFSVNMGVDVREALARVEACRNGWILFIGAMHGKKDLQLVQTLIETLPDDIGLLIAGDPLVEGLAIIARASRLDRKNIAVVPRRLTGEERDALLLSGGVVLLAERTGAKSVSGVLADALGCSTKVITLRDCATGDIVDASGSGATYSKPITAEILEAFSSTSKISSSNTALEQFGLFRSTEWARSALEASRNGAPHNLTGWLR